MRPHWTPYEIGRQWEYAVKEKYEKLGYSVMRSSGSHGKFDLICVRPQKITDITDPTKPPLDGHIILVQCKTGKSKRLELNKLRDSPLKAQFEGIYRVTVSFE